MDSVVMTSGGENKCNKRQDKRSLAEIEGRGLANPTTDFDPRFGQQF
jgi:hypothetical protein